MNNQTSLEFDELPIVKNWLNAKLFPRTGEVEDSKSLTIPDQSMTVAEMLQRQAKGIPISFNAGTPYFLGEEEMPDPERMDLSEIQDLREFISEKKKAAHEKAMELRDKKDKQLRDELAEFRKQKAAQAETQQKPQNATQNGDEGAKI